MRARWVLGIVSPLVAVGVFLAWPRPGPARPEDAGVEAACASCHRLPPPEVLPRAAWRPEVEKMFEIAQERRVDAGVDLEEAVDWYEARAPAALSEPEGRTDAGPGATRWRTRELRPTGAPPTPAVASVRLLPLFGGAGLDLVVCDMRHHAVLAFRPYEAGAGYRLLGNVPHPCHAEALDLDGDGARDLVVADLGVFNPSDETRGQVVWLRGTPEGRFETVVLAGGLGRVADVRPADLDGDGDLDLAVAVFGWRSVGEVMWLENLGPAAPGDPRRFERRPLDPRPGAIHVPVVDLDGDGDLDVVALISQEHETVMAYLREGASFRAVSLYEAPHPNWGFSGMEPVDLDGDGDLDLLCTHGDTLDDSVLKPYHGVSWLENMGGLCFEWRPLTPLHGAHRALAGDLDGDGDVDVVASAFLPQFPEETVRRPLGIEALIELERVPGGWVRRVLEPVRADHPCMDVGDVDGDGDLDLAVGNFSMQLGAWDVLETWVALWVNEGAE